uniref:Uncharacterized protein n=1 Tax=Anguilla anguilla TaxID=7936 RepID=A0A0E9R8C0_ANGAN
MRVQCVHSNVT